MSKKSRSKVKSRMISLIVFVLLACLAVYIYHGLQTPLTVTTYNYHNKKILSLLKSDSYSDVPALIHMSAV